MNRLKQLRKSKGMTQSELAKEIKVSEKPSHVGKKKKH